LSFDLNVCLGTTLVTSATNSISDKEEDSTEIVGSKPTTKLQKIDVDALIEKSKSLVQQQQQQQQTKEEGQWHCSKCTFLNFLSMNVCRACGERSILHENLGEPFHFNNNNNNNNNNNVKPIHEFLTNHNKLCLSKDSQIEQSQQIKENEVAPQETNDSDQCQNITKKRKPVPNNQITEGDNSSIHEEEPFKKLKTDL
jgi:hypothetical protein